MCEIHGIDEAFNVMHDLLKPGGMMLHKIDLTDYGMVHDFGKHALTFLTISDIVYRHMAEDSGKSNRRMIDYYQVKMKEQGYHAKFFITHIRGKKEELLPHKEKIEKGKDYTEEAISLINKMRPKLLKRYQALSDEDLVISGVFLVARKY